jgi:hypothetical protein
MELYKYKGLPATTLLILLITISSLYISKNKSFPIKSISKRLIVISLPFWLWALYHTIRRDLDLGVVSFGSVLLSSNYCFNNNKKCKNYLILSSLLVIFNYIIALPYSKDVGLTIYYCISIFVWLLYVNEILHA